MYIYTSMILDIRNAYNSVIISRVQNQEFLSNFRQVRVDNDFDSENIHVKDYTEIGKNNSLIL